jgi:transcriptional regulator with XRE-family HTH domain
MHSHLGGRLVEARRAKGLTQVQLAAAVGCSPATISIAERSGLLTKATATKLAAMLDVTASYLLES